MIDLKSQPASTIPFPKSATEQTIFLDTDNKIKVIKFDGSISNISNPISHQETPDTTEIMSALKSLKRQALVNKAEQDDKIIKINEKYNTDMINARTEINNVRENLKLSLKQQEAPKIINIDGGELN